MVSAVKSDGFSLLSRDGIAGDSWAFSFAEAYTSLLEDGNRKMMLSILKTLFDRHLEVKK